MLGVRTVRPGDTIRVRLPFSEVMMHMRIAGTARKVRVLRDGVQVLNDDGSDFSFPVTHGEAGVFVRPSGDMYVQEEWL